MSTQFADVDRTVEDVIADLDLDELLRGAVPPPVCEWKTTGAGYAGKPPAQVEECCDAAAWLLACSCGCSAYFCVDHAEKVRRRLAPATAIACSTHRQAVTVDWHQL